MHTFCSYCIKQWKKNKIACPVCRKGITSENRNYLVDNVVNIVSNFQEEEEKHNRKELVQQHKELIENLVTESFLSASVFRVPTRFSPPLTLRFPVRDDALSTASTASANYDRNLLFDLNPWNCSQLIFFSISRVPELLVRRSLGSPHKRPSADLYFG